MGFREPHSISNILKTMEKHGLVKKERKLNNKGASIVRLTKKGKGIYKKMENMTFFVDILSRLSEEERESLAVILKKLRDSAIRHLTELNYQSYP